MRDARWIGLVLLVAAVGPARADQAPWFSNDWAVRRVVEAEVRASGYPGGEVAVCEFYTGGMAKPDASDVRVAVKGRQLVSHRVLQAGPGDFVRVAFEALPEEKRSYVYYGNPKADAPTPWDIQRGVLLEARQLPGGNVRTLEDLRALWQKAEPLGADFLSQVWMGTNPFADDATRAVFHFVGWFVPPRTDTYTLATSSDEGSWILVDEQEVVAWPGAHGPVADARHAKEKPLTQTLHRLDYWNYSQSGTVLCVAAWQTPGSQKFEAIPPEIFLPVARATLVELDLRGEKIVADFFAQRAGEAWWSDHYAIRMEFQDLSSGAAPRAGGRFEWDFGDGQTGDVASPTHIYLAPGDYTVTLKVVRGTLSHTVRNKVRVERNWARQAERDIEGIRKYATWVAKYDFTKLDVPSLLLAVDLFQHQDMPEPLAAAASEIALKRSGVKEEDILATGLVLGRTLPALGRAQEAVKAYLAVEKRLKGRDRQAQAAVQVGETLLKDLHQYDEAEQAYQRVLKEYATAGADASLRRAHIGLGDIWRHRGDGEKTRQSYAAAAAIRVAVLAPNEAAVRVGTLARYVEEYTRQKQWEWAFQFLDDWAWEFPLDKLQGHWSLLAANALLGKGDRDGALREALDLVGANPASPYAVRLLMLAAECHVARGETDKARLLLQTAVEDYPEDPQQDAAKQRLQALGGPVKAP